MSFLDLSPIWHYLLEIYHQTASYQLSLYKKILLLLNTFKELVCARWPSLGDHSVSVKQDSMEVLVICGPTTKHMIFLTLEFARVNTETLKMMNVHM